MAGDWPGNVRELRNSVERACVLASGDVVALEDLAELGEPGAARVEVRPPAPLRPLPPHRPARAGGPAPAPAAPGPSVAIPLGCTLAEAERRIILAHLRHHRTRTRAAQALGIGVRTLYTKLAAWRDDGAETA
jgi:DNA-binding NtrC family response regulator